MDKVKVLLVWLGCLLGLSVVSAQNLTIKGTVNDNKGEPLLGVFVQIKGTQRGATTDMDGIYTLRAQVGDVLRFTFLGMKPVEKKLTAGTTTLDIVMHDDVQQIEGTVVTGYGSRKVASRTVASVAQVQGKEMTKITTANAMESLQGKIAGMVVTTDSGEPGARSKVMIHGLSMYTALFDTRDRGAADPLYIMDGVPVDGDVMTMLNPNDIESVTVLKDAAATSIYGARAANGVILITSKRGRYNERTNISINHRLSVTSLTSDTDKFFNDLVSPREYMDYYIRKDPERIQQAGRRLGYTETDAAAIADRILHDNPYHTRWDKIYYRDFVPVSRTDVSVSGGTNNTAYYLSLGYLDQEGMQLNTGFERYNLNLNVDAKITNWLKAGVSVGLSHSESKGVNNTNGALRLPFYSPIDENGKRKDFITSVLGDINGFLHPYYEAEKRNSIYNSDDIMPVGFLTFEPIEGLTFKTQVGIQYNLYEEESKTLPSFIDYRLSTRENQGEVSRNTGKNLQKTYTNQLEYHFNVGEKNDFTFLLGQESYESSGGGFSASSSQQPSDALTMLSYGKSQISVGDSYSKSTFNSFFTRLEYAYDSRYFIDISGRRDGSSAFRDKKRYDNFWAVGLMWKAKQEKFLEKVDWLTDLNLRLSTGVSGNSRIGDYRNTLLALTSTTYTYQQQPGYATVFPPGNPDLEWERQQKTTVGINFVLNRNTSVSVEYYNRHIHKILSDRPVNRVLGFRRVPDNIGDMENRGWDVTVSSAIYKNKKKDLLVRGNFNFNYNAAKVLSISYGPDYLIKDNASYKVGKDLEWMFPIFKGINNNGDAEWYEAGDDKFTQQTDDSKVTTEFDESKLIQTTNKKRFAPINGGFGFDVSYKAFSLDLSFAYSLGRYIINDDRMTLENPTYFGVQNFSRKVLNYWKQPGDDTDLPKFESDYFLRRDTRVLENASFLRLKSIGLSYNLPEEVLSQMQFFKGIRLTASAYNIFTITPYTGADPEFGGNIATGGYPPTRQFSLGVELKF